MILGTFWHYEFIGLNIYIHFISYEVKCYQYQGFPDYYTCIPVNPNS